uniref:Uncharacterized protein n=1 Tax=Physcomitrium patens TaxID=3218 RepID=A0A2K1KMG1_PHYPA|nr:hypothetical protein PHYPA_005847 [Physcomitrium patens]
MLAGATGPRCACAAPSSLVAHADLFWVSCHGSGMLENVCTALCAWQNMSQMTFSLASKFSCPLPLPCQPRGRHVISAVALTTPMYLSLYVELRSNGGSHGSQFDSRICMTTLRNLNSFTWPQILGVVCHFVWLLGASRHEVAGSLRDIVVGHKPVSVSLLLCGGCLSVVASTSQRKRHVIKLVVFLLFVWGEFMCVTK